MPTGVYICQCNGAISQIIDTAKLASAAAKMKGVAACREHPCFCGSAGLETIGNDVREGSVDKVVIVGCSPERHEETFRRALGEVGLNQYLIERCNIREQCAWPHRDEPDTAGRKAKTMVAMSVVRARYLEPLLPLTYPAVDGVLVVGAGIAGLSAAADLAAAGVTTTVVEKKPYLGGKVVGFHKYFPRMCPPQCGVGFIVGKLSADPKVRLHTQAEVAAVSGSPGQFTVDLVRKPRFVVTEKCTACGQCAAACPVERDNAFDLGHAKTKAVYLPHELAFPRAYTVDRALCPEGCYLCAQTCPTGAIDLTQQEERSSVVVGSILVATGWEPPDASKVERYGHGRFANVMTNLEFERLAALNGPTGGKLLRPGDGRPIKKIAFLQCVGSRDVEHLPYCSQVCCAATLKQLAYVHETEPEAQAYVFYIDMRSIGEYEQMYREAQEKGAIFIRGKPGEVVEKPSGDLVIRAEDTLSGRPMEISVDAVVLATGMRPQDALLKNALGGFDVPEGTDGFANGHVQCFPFETQRNGIYPAGSCQGPMDVASSVRSAAGAAMKAMATLNRTIEVKPTVPVVDKTKCDKCKRCMEECPVDAWFWDESGYPAPDPRKCRQCGICQGGCPLRVISLRNFGIKQVAAMIEAVDPGFAGKAQPTILAMLCGNDAYPAADLAGQDGYAYPANVLSIRVPCAGAVNVAWVTDALTLGIDGVLIAGCHSDQCHFFRGSDLARTRGDNMRETLKRMRTEPDRVRMINLSITDGRSYAQHVHEFVAELRRLGPSPFKG